ncbi:hypothetical protein PBRA_002825 [Plasmodiophora brassicae]|uniref:Uncharacterized protein n=1 Tax=Plasmodiophora brassicae TaxID=37360 RepID=A0A0G4J5H6_PLABS|nr:hypothetical protein PBRA_002825 [Plasmodiophora brassicae]
MAAGILLRFGRREDAEAALVDSKSTLKYKFDPDRIDDELCDFGRARQVLFRASTLMLCHMTILPAERRRLAASTGPYAPRDEEVLYCRDPLDGVDIGPEISFEARLALHSLRLGSRPIFHINGPYLHAMVADFSDNGFSFEYVGGKRFFLHTNVYPNFVGLPEFQTVVRYVVDEVQMKLIGDASKPLSTDIFEAETYIRKVGNHRV